MDCFVASAQNCHAILSRAPRNDRDGQERTALFSVVPANAGTHNHRIALLEQAAAPASRNNAILWLWVPGQARDDSEFFARPVSHTSAFSRHDLSELCISFRPPSEQRAQGKPGADRTHGSRATKSSGGRTTGVTGDSGFPCAMVLRLIRALPGETGLSCHRPRKTQSRLARGHRPLGRQACTTSPSASCALVSRALSVHRISTRVRDDRDPPLVSGETGGFVVLICPTTEALICPSGYFVAPRPLSSWRTPGPITTGICCERDRGPGVTQRYGRSDCSTRSTTCLRRARFSDALERSLPKIADSVGVLEKKK